MLKMAFIASVGLHLILFFGFSLFASPSEKQNDFRTERQRSRQSANAARIRQITTTAILPSWKTTVYAVIYLQAPSNQPSPIPTPIPTATPTMMATPTLSPTVLSTIKPEPTATPALIPTPTATPKPTPTPTVAPTTTPKPVITVRPALTRRHAESSAVRPEHPANAQSFSERLFVPENAETQRGDADVSMASQRAGNAEIGADGTINASRNQRETVQEDNSARARYFEEITKKIAMAKTYPAQARRKGWEDRLIVELEIAPSGKVLSAKMAQASRFQVLNTAALDAITRAQPFPAFDPQVSAAPLSVKIPFEYTLKTAK